MKIFFWPHGLSFGIIVFMMGTIAFTVFSFRQSVDLVRTDYYEQDILWNQKKIAMERAYKTPPSVSYKNGFLLVDWSLALREENNTLLGSDAWKGVAIQEKENKKKQIEKYKKPFLVRVYFYNTKDPAQDIRFEILTKDALFRKNIALSKMKWKLILEYEIEKENYYYLKELLL